MNDNEERGIVSSFLAGVGIGAIVGAAVALLVAPKSGEETREDLRKAAQKLSESTEDLRKRGGELLQSAKSKVQETVQRKRPESEAEESGSDPLNGG